MWLPHNYFTHQLAASHRQPWKHNEQVSTNWIEMAIKAAMQLCIAMYLACSYLYISFASSMTFHTICVSSDTERRILHPASGIWMQQPLKCGLGHR